MNVTERRILRWMCSKLGSIKLKMSFREQLGATSIGHKNRETHLIWFRHVQRRLRTASVWKSLVMQIEGPPKGRDRLKRT